MSNTSPADDLALVRAEIRSLQAKEKRLRDLVLADPEARNGAKYRATVVQAVRNGVDIAALTAAYPEIVAEFVTQTAVTVVKTIEVSE